MPRIALSQPDASIGELLVRALRYPLRGPALITCLVLAFVYLAGALPGILGAVVHVVYWALAWGYAATCLIHAAHGYAEPPDVGVEERRAAGIQLAALHLLAMLACIGIAALELHWLWLLVAGLVLVLPAIDMSLAFDGDVNIAFHPAHWWRTATGFGALYMLPVAINLLALATIVGMGAVLKPALPLLLGWLLYGFAGVYLVIFNLQLMGALVHRRHEVFGVQPEAERLAAVGKQDVDSRLLAEVDQLRANDPRAALDLLVERLRTRSAPASVHRCYRDVLRQAGMQDALLEHGQIWAAALVAHKEMPRALSLVQECMELDPAFVPDDPITAGPLAEQAERMGMRQLAIHLSRGYLRQWPQAPESPRYGLLAARLIASQPERRMEASLLLGRLAAAWPDHPLQSQMQALLRELNARLEY
jgi:hypothetical protein